MRRPLSQASDARRFARNLVIGGRTGVGKRWLACLLVQHLP